jgi:hypothetical protein
MKAYTLHQPWASLVAWGEKVIETRPYNQGYRGELAIHAAKTFPDECVALCRREPFRSVLLRHGIEYPSRLPRGVIVSVHTLLTTYRFGPNEAHRLRPPYRNIAPFNDPIPFGEFEADFGDFTEGRYGLVLTNRRLLSVPVAARGMQGIWPVDDGTADLVRRRAA